MCFSKSEILTRLLALCALLLLSACQGTQTRTPSSLISLPLDQTQTDKRLSLLQKPVSSDSSAISDAAQPLPVSFRALAARPSLLTPPVSSSQPLPIPGLISPSLPSSALLLQRSWTRRERTPLWRYAPDPSMALLRHRLVTIAKRSVGRKGGLRVFGQTFRFDCSGFASYVYRHLGIHLMLPSEGDENGVRRIVFLARETKVFHLRKIPEIGDLVFWDRTYDTNGDGRLNDSYTHVGIVENIAADGTISYIHHASNKIARGWMNLFLPKDQRHHVNSRLRACRTAHDQCHSAQLWSGFASFLQPHPLDKSPLLSGPKGTSPNEGKPASFVGLLAGL